MVVEPKLRRLARCRLDMKMDCISPGAMHSCRLGTLAPTGEDGNCNVLLACGSDVHSVTIPVANSEAIRWGREGIALPTQLQPATTRCWAQLKHRAEVQSVEVREGPDIAVLATVDAYGHANVALFGISNGTLHLQSHHKALPLSPTREAGWAGVALVSPECPNLAVARQFPRDCCLYDGDRVVRTFCLLNPPLAVRFIGNGVGAVSSPPDSLLAVAEGHQVSVWDGRAAEKGGCVERLSSSSSSSPFYCVTSDDTGAILGAAGGDRGVCLWDARKWHVLERWNNVTKYEAYFLMLCSGNSRHAVVAGLDPEVVCGRWDAVPSRKGGATRSGDGPSHFPRESSAAQHLSFRGTSRWLGVAKATGTDTYAGFSATKDIFVAQYHFPAS
eukprot:jgi/Botrbrau1/21741/Bobra.43_1s0135.1